MTKTSKFKRGLCLLLAMIFIVGFIPTQHAHAASNVDGGLEGQTADVFTALGFDTSVEPEGYDADTVDNPYGRTKVTGTQIWEALVTTVDGTATVGAGNGDTNNDLGASDVVKASVSGDVPLEMYAVAAADFDNDGLTGEAVYVGYPYMMSQETDWTTLYMYVYDAKTDSFSNELNLGRVYAGGRTIYGETTDMYKKAFSMYAGQNMLQVTAGDYDGDGTYEIAVYVAGNDARVDIYKWMRDQNSTADDWMDMGNWTVVWSYMLSNTYIPNMVSLHSADINQDGIDDLSIAYGETTNTYAAGDYQSQAIFSATKSSAVILWGDRNKMLQNKYNLNLDAAGLGDLVRVSITTGDLNGDGYKEIVVAGQPLSDYYQNNIRTAIIYNYDGVGGLTKVYGENFKICDGYYNSGSWVSNNGYDQYYKSQAIMNTNAAVFKAQGYEYGLLYLDSCIFEYIEGALTLKMCLDDPSYDGTNTLNNTWLSNEDYAEFGAVAMDINGDGYQKLFVSYYTANSSFYSEQYGKNSRPYLVNYRVNSGFCGMEGVDGTMQVYSKNTNYLELEPEYFGGLDWASPETTGCYYVAAVNCDMDTTVLEYTGKHWLTYQDPKVLAVIAAAPYFEDVDVISDYDYAWQNATSWSKMEGGGHGSTVQVDFEIGAYLATGSKFHESETALLFTLEWAKDTTESTEYTLSFETSQDEDAVAFFSIPTEHYEYTIYAPNEKGEYELDTYVISRPFRAVYQVLTLDYYESIRGDYDNLPAIRGEILTSTPGDPSSYPDSTAGYDVITKWKDDPAGISFGNGAITQEITISTEESESYNLGAAVDVQAGGGYKGETFEILGGVTFSLNPSGGWTDFTVSGTTISGTITNMPLEFQDYGYYYDWSLFSYAANIDGGTVPVVSYVVGSISEPPQLPDDFQQDIERTTANKNVLTWTYDDAYSSFILYRYFDFPIGGGLQEIARFAAGETPYTLKTDENGKLYYEFYYEDTNLAPYSEYEYAIQVERLSETPPLSAPSGLLTARTKAAEGNPTLTIVESDGVNDGTAMVYPDKNSYLIAQVAGPDGEKGSSYYTTIQYQWQKKDNQGKWEDLINETNQTLTIASAGSDVAGEYRCRINVITNTDNTAISTYTKSVSLNHSKRTSVIREAYAVDMAGKIKVFAKVGNPHTDSATIPDGYVTFNFVNTATNASYPVNVPLDSTGVASVVSTNSLPNGQYRVYVSYSGSYVFKSSSKEIYYTSGLDASYVIDAVDSVVYGNGTQVSFSKLTVENGITTANAANAKYMVLAGDETEIILKSSGYVTTAVGAAPSVPSGYTLIQAGDPVAKGQNYLIKFLSNRNAQGENEPKDWYIKFSPDFSGIVEKADWNNSNARIHIKKDIGCLTHTDTGIYTLSDNTPAGTYTLAGMANDGLTAKRKITVTPRAITLQLPTVVKKQDSGVTMGDITFRELNVISGSWAPCDTDDNGNISGAIASTSVAPGYTNTAGTAYDKDTALTLCGYYTIDATGTLGNYVVSYRTGSLSVIGGNQPMTFGVRPFENQTVGTLYMVAPDYAYTRDDAITLAQAVGSRVVFTAAPDEGYQVYDWYVNGVAQGISDSRFAHVMMNESCTVEVQFVFKPDTLVYGISGDAEGGTLVCSDSSLNSGSIVIPNSYLTFTAQAKEGYHFKEWRYTELGKGTAYYTEDSGKQSSTFQLLMPKISCSLYAVFERDGYTLTYTDKAGIDGLTAWYWGIPNGDTTAALEKIPVKSGDSIPGGTEVVVQLKDGFELDKDYNFVATGSQGEADYNKGTYTFVITEDTHITGYTTQNTYKVTVSFDVTKTYAAPEGTKVKLTVAGQDYIYDYVNGKTYSVSAIPGGSKVTVSVTYPNYYKFGGWDVNGSVKSTESYVINELGENTTFKLKLTEKPVYKVTLASISGKGSYSVTLPAGAGKSGNVVTCHENDPLTIQITPNSGYTVTYWNVSAENGQGWETKASSLKYQFPQLNANYTFTPIFSTTTYHTITWSSLPYYDVTLTPEEGYLSTVSSGSTFKFTLSGGEDNYEYVLVNGREFKEESSGSQYPFQYKDVNGVRVYTISNITANQEITLSTKAPEYGMTVTPDAIVVPAGKSVTLTAETYGINLDLITWNVYTQNNLTTKQQGADKTFVFQAPTTPNATMNMVVEAGNSENGQDSKIVSVNVPITVTDAVKKLDITNDDLVPQSNGSYLIHTITPTGEIGKYDFDALVTMYSGNYNSKVTWSLWGAQMRSTTIDANGVLTVSPKEYGTDSKMKVIATYTYDNGDIEKREVLITLSPDAYVATERVGTDHGDICADIGYVSNNTTVTVTATPDENHAVASWYMDGVAVANNTTNTLTFTAKEMTHYLVGVEFNHYYPTLEHDSSNHWYECSCGDRIEIENHYDFDKDHFCDKCSYRTSNCADENKDHFCEWCSERMTDCADEVQDHICDWCGETLSVCADENKDHFCEWCGERMTECADDNNNHFCDYCKERLSDCEDKNLDHNCDVCGRALTECADNSNDHLCDICGEALSECEDKDTNHICDICEAILSACADEDSNHICDICDETISECKDEDSNHICDICGKTLSFCADNDEDGMCDICGEELIVHDCADEDNNHACDVCGEVISECKDDDSNHKCDICEAILSACADEDSNHICDICGETLGACADDDRNHVCDICGEPVGECKDENNDHKCDICDEPISECKDEDSNHICDICSETLGECKDDDSDHCCDVCGSRLTICIDNDADGICDICDADMHECIDAEADEAGYTDHLCDICGYKLTECTDVDMDDNGNTDHKCDICGKSDSVCVDNDSNHKCDICGEIISECINETNDHLCDICGEIADTCIDVDHNDICDICGAETYVHTDENKDHRCDACLLTLSECEDTNSDHLCDYCSIVWTPCVDENKDHICEVCSGNYGSHEAAEGSHICDYCGKLASDCTDESKDHACDVCGEIISVCADNDSNHLCDVCSEILSSCADEDSNHLCDICDEALSACKDDDNNHKCDICGETISACKDEDNNHVCDICGETVSACKDEDNNHVCDICGETVSACKDDNSNHKCDICNEVLSACKDDDNDLKCDICGYPMNDVIRVSGANRFKTAFKVADELKHTLGVEMFDAVIIASGTNFADALSGSYLATVKNAPMLLSLGDANSADLHAYIENNLVKGGTVYILGGNAAVPSTLDVMMEGYTVVRLAGSTRYETNLRILEEAGVSADQDILVCTGTNFADALSASALNRPILMVGKSLTQAQKDFLADKNGNFYILGGTGAVSASMEDELNAYGQVERLGGKSRYETSVIIAQKFFENTEHAVLVYAKNFPDGLSGGMLAYSLNAPLILTDSNKYDVAEDYATANGITRGYVLGGTGLVSDEAVSKIFSMDADEIILNK